MCTASHSLFKRKPSESWAFLRAKTRLLCAQDAVADGEAVQPREIEPVDLREHAVVPKAGLALKPADGADGIGVVDAGDAQRRHLRKNVPERRKHPLNDMELQVFLSCGNGLHRLPDGLQRRGREDERRQPRKGVNDVVPCGMVGLPGLRQSVQTLKFGDGACRLRPVEPIGDDGGDADTGF